MRSFAETYVASAAKEGKKWIPIEHAVSLQCLVEALRNETERLQTELTTTKTQLLSMAQANTDQAAQIEEMQKELTRLKTPHTCGECEKFKFASIGYGCPIAPVEIQDRNTKWICGHFQPKKGTE